MARSVPSTDPEVATAPPSSDTALRARVELNNLEAGFLSVQVKLEELSVNWASGCLVTDNPSTQST